MVLKGITILPISVNKNLSLKIYKQLSKTNLLIGRMDALISNSIVNESLLSLLSFNESVQSTRIEGTQVTFHNFMENKDKSELNWQETEVVNYNEALKYGISQITEHQMPISTRLIKELHNILMNGARGSLSSSGQFRKVQNFIGPNNKIEDAVYVPISQNEINNYMENLEFFINGENHSSFTTIIEEEKETFDYTTEPLLKMAISHAQFESIHPFLDGNGRLGRILLVLISVKTKLVSSPIFFVSEELEKERVRYYNSLNSTRGDTAEWSVWLLFFLQASERMANNIIRKLNEVDILARKGLNLCQTDTQKNIWITTFSSPVATTKQISDMQKIHHSTAKKALDYLVSQNLLDKDLSKKRNQQYFNYDLLRTIGS